MSPIAEDLARLIGNAAEAAPATVEALLQGLEEEDSTLLRRCAIPHQFNPGIVRSLADGDLSEAQAAQKLERLSRLAVVSPGSHGFALHDRARGYLFRLWLTGEKIDEFRRISRRLVEHFSAPNESADAERSGRRRMFHLIGCDQDRGFEEFERLCRLRRSELRLSECESLIRLVHEYDVVLTAGQGAVLDYHEAKLLADRADWSAAAAKLHRIVNDESLSADLRVKAMNRLGMLEDECRHWHSAISWFCQALKLAARQGRRTDMYRVLNNLGTTYLHGGDLGKAEKQLRVGLRLAEKAASDSGTATAFNSLGNLYKARGDLDMAVDAYDSSLKFLAKANERFRPAQVFNNIGEIYAEMLVWERSEFFFRKSLQIKQEAGDTRGQARSYSGLIRVLRNLGREAEAVECANRAIQLFEAMEDWYYLGVTRRRLARLHKASGREEDSEREFRAAREALAKAEVGASGVR